MLLSTAHLKRTPPILTRQLDYPPPYTARRTCACVSVSIRFDDCVASATLGGVINRFIMRRAGEEGTRPPVKMRPVFPSWLLNGARRDLNDKVAASACARSRE